MVFADDDFLAVGLSEKVVQKLVVETNQRLTEPHILLEVRLHLRLELCRAIGFKGQFWLWRGFKNTGQWLESPDLGLLLDGENEQHCHRQHKKKNLDETVLFHGSESEIDERAEIGGIQGGHAENEGESGHNPNDNVLDVSIFGEIHLLLRLLAELGQREEREEGRHNHRGVKLRVSTERQQRELEGEHPLDEQPSQAEILDAEEHPD